MTKTGDETSLSMKVDDIPVPPSIYFGGCAFGAAFYVGVFQAMVDKWGKDFYKKVLWTGGSAGTIFAISIALGKSPEDLNNLYRTVAEKTNRYGPIHYGSVFLEDCVRCLMSDPIAYKHLEGRCCFGTTAFFDKHRWHVAWEDNEDFIQCAKASCHIPFYCQKNSGIKGTLVVDGAYGFSGTDLPHGDATLYVGIDPHAEITRTLTNNEMMYPVVGKEYDDMVRSGYDAFMAWDGSYIAKVGNRKPNYQALYVLWTLKVVEFFYHGLLYYVDIIYLAIVTIPLYILCWLPMQQGTTETIHIPASKLHADHHSFMEHNRQVEQTKSVHEPLSVETKKYL